MINLIVIASEMCMKKILRHYDIQHCQGTKPHIICTQLIKVDFQWHRKRNDSYAAKNVGRSELEDPSAEVETPMVD